MPLMDEFKDEREKLKKNGTFGQKLGYFWDYYKIPVIIVTVIIIFIIYLIHHYVTATKDVLTGQFLNVRISTGSDIIDGVTDDFEKSIKLDTKEYSVSIGNTLSYVPVNNENPQGNVNNYATIETLTTWIAAGTVDFVSADFKTVNELAYRQYFDKPDDVMKKDDLKRYEPYFLYMDQAVADEIEKASKENMEPENITYPDCDDPDSMKKPVPMMIDISDAPLIKKLYPDTGKVGLAFTVTAEHKENAVKFLDFIMSSAKVEKDVGKSGTHFAPPCTRDDADDARRRYFGQVSLTRLF